jgi:transglutaminase-like putative cysteine protease
MASDEAFHDIDGSPDYARVGLVVVGLVGALIAAGTLPVLAPTGAGPAGELMPVPEPPEELKQAGTGQGSSLGALSPGDATQVGGDLGGENALQSQNTETHFIVETDTPTYMRTGGFNEYTGSGWRQTGESRSYDPPIETRGQTGNDVRYEVTLKRAGLALPTPWRPRAVSESDVRVTAADAIRSTRPLPEGTTYSGRSTRPIDDPALLRAAGTDYPAAIAERYTQVPDETAAALGPRTANITAGATTQYDRAVAIEDWLESNKAYSLNVSQPPDGDVATQFVTEMEAGYCEYFATSMVAMLRTQDIPARYVVGYSNGEPVGDGRYEVRGMNAHAWVEVYFPKYGWVTFDPTPAAERQAEEDATLEEAGITPATETPETATEVSGPESDTPTGSGDTPAPTGTEAGTASGETQSPGGESTTTATPRNATPTETPTESPPESTPTEDGEFETTLNRSAVPGVPVTVTVTQDGETVSDVEVLFNNDSIGITDAAGNVTGEVPYTEELRVTVRADEGSSTAASIRAPAGVAGSGFGPDARRDRQFAIADPSAESTDTYDVPTNATIELYGDHVTEERVSITATVAGEPVKGGRVLLNGTQIVKMGDAGLGRLMLPPEPGPLTIAVVRGDVRGSTEVRLPKLAMTTEPTTPLPYPLTTMRVNATADGVPAPNATVAIDGSPVGKTGVDGTQTVRLPFATTAQISVARNGQTRTTTIGGLYLNLAATLGGFGLLVAGSAVLWRRYGLRQRSATGLRLLVQLVLAGLIAVGAALDAGLDRLWQRARITRRLLAGLARGEQSLASLAAALRAWLPTLTESLPGRRMGSPGTTGTDTAPADKRPETTIRDGWQRFLGTVSLRRPQLHTPAEIARYAITVDDLPADAVETIVDAFRAVEYGGRQPDERAPAVEAALDRIQHHRTQDRTEDDH